jgi:hypothetical protein
MIALILLTVAAHASMSRTDFEDAVEALLKNYPQISIRSDWESQKLAAVATRDEQDRPIVTLSGGMARHSELTPDGLRLILCHEIGHFMGGAPKALRGNSDRRSWSSVEGQADYFATAKCLRTLFAGDPEPARTERIIQAGESAARMFAAITGETRAPSVKTPDRSNVFRTLSVHPSAQCRLDTFVVGANCPIPAEAGLDDLDPMIGACARPACWFKEARDAS